MVVGTSGGAPPIIGHPPTVFDIVLPVEVVAHNRRVLPHHGFGTPISLGEVPAELVHRRVGVNAHGLSVLAHVGPGENPTRPFAEVVPFQRFEEVLRNMGRVSDLLDGDPALQTGAPQVWAEGFPSHGHSTGRKFDTTRHGTQVRPPERSVTLG